jgi:DNA-binding IclR family transcriptional regulator
VLSALPAAQVRALYPDASAFVDRHGTGPRSLSALRSVLSETRRRGYATEHGAVTPGFGSVAAPVLDHNGHPVAGVAVTYDESGRPDVPALADAVRRAASHLTQRLGGPG